MGIYCICAGAYGAGKGQAYFRTAVMNNLASLNHIALAGTWFFSLLAGVVGAIAAIAASRDVVRKLKHLKRIRAGEVESSDGSSSPVRTIIYSDDSANMRIIHPLHDSRILESTTEETAHI